MIIVSYVQLKQTLCLLVLVLKVSIYLQMDYLVKIVQKNAKVVVLEKVAIFVPTQIKNLMKESVTIARKVLKKLKVFVFRLNVLIIVNYVLI